MISMSTMISSSLNLFAESIRDVRIKPALPLSIPPLLHSSFPSPSLSLSSLSSSSSPPSVASPPSVDSFSFPSSSEIDALLLSVYRLSTSKDLSDLRMLVQLRLVRFMIAPGIGNIPKKKRTTKEKQTWKEVEDRIQERMMNHYHTDGSSPSSNKGKLICDRLYRYRTAFDTIDDCMWWLEHIKELAIDCTNAAAVVVNFNRFVILSRNSKRWATLTPSVQHAFFLANDFISSSRCVCPRTFEKNLAALLQCELSAIAYTSSGRIRDDGRRAKVRRAKARGLRKDMRAASDSSSGTRKAASIDDREQDEDDESDRESDTDADSSSDEDGCISSPMIPASTTVRVSTVPPVVEYIAPTTEWGISTDELRNKVYEERRAKQAAARIASIDSSSSPGAIASSAAAVVSSSAAASSQSSAGGGISSSTSTPVSSSAAAAVAPSSSSSSSSSSFAASLAILPSSSSTSSSSSSSSFAAAVAILPSSSSTLRLRSSEQRNGTLQEQASEEDTKMRVGKDAKRKRETNVHEEIDQQTNKKSKDKDASRRCQATLSSSSQPAPSFINHHRAAITSSPLFDHAADPLFLWHHYGYTLLPPDASSISLASALRAHASKPSASASAAASRTGAELLARCQAMAEAKVRFVTERANGGTEWTWAAASETSKKVQGEERTTPVYWEDGRGDKGKGTSTSVSVKVLLHCSPFSQSLSLPRFPPSSLPLSPLQPLLMQSSAHLLSPPWFHSVRVPSGTVVLVDRSIARRDAAAIAGSGGGGVVFETTVRGEPKGQRATKRERRQEEAGSKYFGWQYTMDAFGPESAEFIAAMCALHGCGREQMNEDGMEKRYRNAITLAKSRLTSMEREINNE